VGTLGILASIIGIALAGLLFFVVLIAISRIPPLCAGIFVFGLIGLIAG
jgi:hypothetical protein